MSRKLSALILALSLSAALSACSKNNSTSEAGKPAATATPSVTTLNSGKITPKSTTYPDSDKTVIAPEGVLHNATVGEDVQLPADVPTFPSAKQTSKRVTNTTYIFDYHTSA